MNLPAFLQINLDSMDFLFDRETAFIRRIRWNGVEVIRAIYAAVRDRNWETIPPIVTGFVQRDESSGTFVEFSVECLAGEIDYAYVVQIGATPTELHFSFEGTARSSFLKNRLGICVLHPITLCAGLACEVRHTNGEIEQGHFPRCVAPFQPFLDMQAITHAAGEGTTVEIAFSGDIFEMEDQRNWTDASFKTYCTPLALPFPSLVRAGEKARQSVTVRFTGKQERPPSWRVSETMSVLHVNFSELTQKPRIGLSTPAPLVNPAPGVIENLRALELDHLRVDCVPSARKGCKELILTDHLAASLGTGLHVAVFLQGDGERELKQLAEVCRSLRAPVKMWLIYDRTRKSTPTESVRLAQSILGSICAEAKFAAGTNANFAELNRERPPAGADWHPCFSINPQVHAKDDLTLIENLQAQREVARAAAGFANGAVVVSPVTLLPRFNPNPTDSKAVGPCYDPRQSTLFAAGWTLGSFAALCAESAFSLTYFETTGPGGVMNNDGQLYPVYHVFRGLSKMRQLAASRIEGEPDLLSCLAGIEKDGRKVIWLANHRQEPQSCRLLGAGSSIKVKLLTTADIAAAESHPDTWWSSGLEEHPTDVPLVLPSLALARVEVVR